VGDPAARVVSVANPIVVGAGRRQEQANWAGLKRFLERQDTLVGNPETERDLRQAQAMRSVR
jgi:hypothetical protein